MSKRVSRLGLVLSSADRFSEGMILGWIFFLVWVATFSVLAFLKKAFVD